MKRFNKIQLLGLLVILLWGFSFPTYKWILNNTDQNYLMAFFSYSLVSFLILIPFAIRKKESTYFKSLDFKLFILLACMNAFYNLSLIVSILKCEEVQYSVIANYLWPILIAFFVAVSRRERIPPNIIAGVILGFVAVVIISWPDSNSAIASNIVGIGLAVVAAILWALYSTILHNRPEFDKVSTSLQGLSMLVSTVIAFIAAMVLGTFDITVILSPKAILSILTFAVFITGLAYVLWIEVISKHENVYQYVIQLFALPFLGVFLTSLFFGSQNTGKIWTGLIVLLIGILIAHFDEIKQKLTKQKSI